MKCKEDYCNEEATVNDLCAECEELRIESELEEAFVRYQEKCIDDYYNGSE